MCTYEYVYLALAMTGVEPEPFKEGEHLVHASGKLIVLDRLLDYLKRTGHRVLLFSQFSRVLDVVQDFLDLRGTLFESAL